MPCHEDLTAADLAGRFLLDGASTVWADGPLTTAVRHGAICYLDEIVEARQDTTVVIHPLADNRRVLPLDRNRELVPAHPDFLLVVSYNPGYQNAAKDLKESTKQRFVAIDFTYPAPAAEADIVARETGIDLATADLLVDVAGRTRKCSAAAASVKAPPPACSSTPPASLLPASRCPTPSAPPSRSAHPTTPTCVTPSDALIAACLP